MAKITIPVVNTKNQKITKITRRLLQKSPKKWVGIVSGIVNNLYGEDACYRQSCEKITIYVPKNRIYKYIYSIIEKIEEAIEQNKNTNNEFTKEEDICVVFEDGVSMSCEWRIEQIIRLKSACLITHEIES